MILTEAENTVAAHCAGLERASPPSLTGNPKSSLSKSFSGGLPVRVGRRAVPIDFSEPICKCAIMSFWHTCSYHCGL